MCIKLPTSLGKYLMDRGDKKFLRQTQKFGTYNTFKNVTYFGNDIYSRSNLLDAYMPVNDKNGYTIINVHGGGYFQGDKDYSEVYCSYFVSKGFTVININYSLINNKENIDIRKQIFDIVMAFNFIYDRRIEYDIDLNNVFLMGDSAGGHLAILASLVLEDEELQKYYNIPFVTPLRFRAIETSSPMYDYVELCKKAKKYFYPCGVAALFSKHYKDIGFLNKNSLKTYVENTAYSFPPIFLLTCENDFFKEESIKFYLALKKRNAQYIYYFENSVNKYVGHIFNHFNFDKKEINEANDKIIAFFESHAIKGLKKKI